MANAVAVDEVFALASQLPIAEKARLIAQLADELAAVAPTRGSKPLLGIAADLGSAPSARDIDEARSEMFGGAR